LFGTGSNERWPLLVSWFDHFLVYAANVKTKIQHSQPIGFFIYQIVQKPQARAVCPPRTNPIGR